MSAEDKCYCAWRRSEAWQVPVTQEGMEQAEERYKQFKKGYYAGVRACALELEREHSANKYLHKFFLVAKGIVERLLK